jgi:hypothetical protein
MTLSTRRRFLGAIARLTAALPVINWCGAMAHQRLPRIGFMAGAEPSLIPFFEEEMRKLGYVPGKNIHIEMRVGRRNTNDAAEHAIELGAMDLNFVVVAALPQALLMRQANPGHVMITIDIVEPYLLHLNKRAAAALGLTLPADLLTEADKVLS